MYRMVEPPPQSKAVILRESGVSSTPQILDLMADALEYWITRVRG
jgi:hypothetical protein